MRPALNWILNEAAFHFSLRDDDVAARALSIAACAVGDIDEVIAKEILEHAALLAAFIKEEVEGLTPATRARLEVILGTDVDDDGGDGDGAGDDRHAGGAA